jgi:hypothetical protein
MDLPSLANLHAEMLELAIVEGIDGTMAFSAVARSTLGSADRLMRMA